MGYKVFEKKKAIERFNDFILKQEVDVSFLDGNHLQIRNFFMDRYASIKQKLSVSEMDLAKKRYLLDMELSLDFYEFMNSQKDFDQLYASDYGFWTTVAIYDIPDIILDRWKRDSGNSNEENPEDVTKGLADHFYRKTTRVYPYVLYWYADYSWQGSKDKTREILKNNNEDVILQLVERTTKIGTNLDFYRTLMKEYADSKYDVIKSQIAEKAKKTGKTISLFRLALVKNTEKLSVLRPEIYSGGIENYVKMILDVGANLQ